MANEVGGSFAPPITDDMLKKWEKLNEKVGGLTGKAIEQLIETVRTHRKHVPTRTGGKPHKSGKGTIFNLSTKAKEACENCLPSADERKLMGQMFESLSGDERNMAFHLLWYANEIGLDREPITSDLVE